MAYCTQNNAGGNTSILQQIFNSIIQCFLRPSIFHNINMKSVLSVLFFFTVLTGSTQSYNSDKINRKAIAVYEKALVKLRDGEIKAAIPLLQNAFQLDKNYVDALLSLAGAYGELKDYQSAVA